MIAVILLCTVAGLILILYRSTKPNYWKEKGIPHLTPLPFIGNMLDNVLKKKSLSDVVKDIGFTFKDEPLVGFYNFTRPTLLINSPDYAEIVLVKEFSRFMNRGEDLKVEERRPYDNHLFFLTGTPWKGVRTKMTPAFTTAKLKGMVTEIERVFDNTFKDIGKTGGAVNLSDIIEKFTVRVRASCVFGLDLTKSAMEEDEFLKRVKNMTKQSLITLGRNVIGLFFPKVAKQFNISFFGENNENYFVNVLLSSFKERCESNIVKQDFVQLMLELKSKGKVEVQYWTKEDDFLKSNESATTTSDTVEITDDIIISQILVFLVAGLEPTLTTLTMLLVELIQNTEIYEKVKQEIEEVIGRQKEFSYQALKEMSYLELCILETLRLHTPAEILARHCCRKYTFPNGTTVNKGTDLIIPIMRFHYDESLFPDPLAFIPERQIDDSGQPCSNLPFGAGPRMCLGMRFAMIEMKILASKIIYNYDMTLDPRTELPIQTSKWSFLKKCVSPVYIKICDRKK